MVAIENKNVCFSYDNTVILEDISFTVKPGSVFLVTGPAGSGTTTLLKLMAGLLQISSGSIFINNKDISLFTKEDILDYHKNSGFAFQNAALINTMTVYENLTLYYKYHTKISDKRVNEHLQPYLEYLKSFDLNLRPTFFSMGEKIIISIIRAISHDPDIIFIDEADANLDQITLSTVNDIVMALKKQKKTIIMASHNMKFGLAHADEIAILYNTRLIETGPIKEVLKSRNEMVMKLLS